MVTTFRRTYDSQPSSLIARVVIVILSIVIELVLNVKMWLSLHHIGMIFLCKTASNTFNLQLFYKYFVNPRCANRGRVSFPPHAKSKARVTEPLNRDLLAYYRNSGIQLPCSSPVLVTISHVGVILKPYQLGKSRLIQSLKGGRREEC